MSPSRLQLEGNSVAEVMARVDKKFGSLAHVVDAQKVRTKGLGGFFAREYYVVTVEVPAGLVAEDSGLAEGAPRASVTAGAEVPVRREGGSAAPEVPVTPVFSVGGQLSGLDAMLAAADGGDGFEASTPAVTTSQSESRPATRATEPERDFSQVLRSAQAMAQEVAHEVSKEFEATTFARVHKAQEQPQQPQQPQHPHQPQRGVSAAELAEIGIPATLLNCLPRTQTTVTLSEVMRHVPTPPELVIEDGQILVVLGFGTRAKTHATQVAQDHGMNEADLVAAGPRSAEHGGPRLILTASSAREARKTARETGRPLVVHLDVGESQSDRYLAARLLAALDPDYTLGVVRAGHDMNHVARNITDVLEGGQLTSIAVEGLVGTPAPGRVLSLGIPVSHIDHFPANVVVWAAAMSTALPQITWD